MKCCKKVLFMHDELCCVDKEIHLTMSSENRSNKLILMITIHTT